MPKRGGKPRKHDGPTLPGILYRQLDGFDDGDRARPASLNVFRYVFIAAQLLHGAGAAAILTLGPTLLDETLDKTRAPLYIGIFESSFVLGPAIG